MRYSQRLYSVLGLLSSPRTRDCSLIKAVLNVPPANREI
jgi:hypothetical protein